METENQKLLYNNDFLFNIINKIKDDIDTNDYLIQKYSEEIEKIYMNIKNKEEIIDISNILNLTKQKNIDNKINNKIDQEIIINEEKLNQLINELNKKIENSSKKYNSLIKSYIELIDKYNKKIKEEKLLSNELRKINDNIYNKLMPKIKDLEEDNIFKDKRYNENSEQMINNMNDLINKAINKIKKIELDKDNEINSLYERIDYFIKEMKIIKKSNEALAKDKSSAYEIQKEKYENQLKIKNETIKKLEEYIYQQNKLKQEGDKNILDLNEELKHIKVKYELQNQNIVNIEQRYKEQNRKNFINNVSTGKYVINDYLNKLGQFANGLFNFNNDEDK